MKFIVAGTNRPGSNTMKVCLWVQKLYADHQEQTEILDLRTIELEKMAQAPYGNDRPESLRQAVGKINRAEGLILVVPEYNGSMPGILKYFIDHWQYPESFEARPVALIGLGYRFGGVRPVEHLQQILGYRNSYVFPERVFIANIGQAIQDGKIVDPEVQKLLTSQVVNFQKFVRALQSERLDANSRLQGPA
jgi:chromate reductase